MACGCGGGGGADGGTQAPDVAKPLTTHDNEDDCETDILNYLCSNYLSPCSNGTRQLPVRGLCIRTLSSPCMICKKHASNFDSIPDVSQHNCCCCGCCSGSGGRKYAQQKPLLRKQVMQYLRCGRFRLRVTHARRVHLRAPDPPQTIRVHGKHATLLSCTLLLCCVCFR